MVKLGIPKYWKSQDAVLSTKVKLGLKKSNV